MTSDSPKRLLLVDDDPFILEGFKEILEKSGYEVFPFNNPKDVILFLNKKDAPSFDGCILDLDMPNLGGVELYKSLPKSNEKTPVIFISGLASPSKEAIEYVPGAEFLKKPFSYEDLTKTLEKILTENDEAPTNELD